LRLDAREDDREAWAAGSKLLRETERLRVSRLDDRCLQFGVTCELGDLSRDRIEAETRDDELEKLACLAVRLGDEDLRHLAIIGTKGGKEA